MIGNIIEYVHSYGYFDFEALPFSEVDALVLAQFVYLKIEALLEPASPDNKPVTLRQMQQNKKFEALFTDTRYEENNKALFKAMCESKRYGNMECMYCSSFICRTDEMQFMALTCRLSDGSIKILYRGTDETLVGWKEDFNMSFQYPVPGQDAGRKYLETVSKYIREKPLDLIGHSKGGNLAVYAAMNVDEQIQKRIHHIYNLDGPGFRTEVYRMGLFEKISDKIIKIIPRSSIVGMILENHGEYRIVDSSNIGLLQHDPYSWRIDRIQFVYVESLDRGRKLMDESLNEWIQSFKEEEVSEFVNTLYQIVSASEATDLICFTKNWTKSLSGIAGAIQELDEETKSKMYHIMKRLASASGAKLKEETGNYIHNKIEDITLQLTSKEGK